MGSTSRTNSSCDAKRLLVAAFRSPTNAGSARLAFLKPEGGRDEILEAIAGIFGDDAADVLFEAASDADPQVRLAAVNSMGWRLTKSTDQVRLRVRDALRDPDARVVVAALEEIKSHPDSEAGPAVLELLRHPRSPKREPWDSPVTYNIGDFAGYTTRPGFDEALEAIGDTAYAGALDELLRLTRDPSACVRSSAADAIARCAANADAAQRTAALARLRALLDDPNRSVCLSASKALAELHDSSGLPAMVFELIKLIRPRADWEEQRVVPLLQALEKLTGEDFGSSLGEKAWESADREKFKMLQSRVNSILERLRAKGLPTEGYPRLPTKLPAADKEMFDRAFAKWLVDPRGAIYVSFPYDERTAWGTTEKRRLLGWLFPAKGNQPACVLLDDRASFPAPAKSDVQDLVGQTRRELAGFLAGKEFTPSAIDAAWLYRLGHEDLAAQLLFLRGATAIGTTLTSTNRAKGMLGSPFPVQSTPISSERTMRRCSCRTSGSALPQFC